jgi:hypothetical protein
MADAPDFKSYWELRMKGATDRLKAAQQIVSHTGTRGNLAENLLRELIREFLPLRYGVGTGFVMDAEGNRSKQVDILIYDQLHASTVFRDGELVVLSPKNVLVAIEVKSQLTGSAQDTNDIAAAYGNIASVRGINPEVRGFIFGYDGNAAETFVDHVNTWAAKPNAPPRSVWPDQVFNMGQNFLILPPEPDTEQTRADNNRQFTVVAGDDPVVRTFLTATLTAIGVENLRAFFGEDKTGETISTI